MLRGLGLVSLSALGAVLMPHVWMDQIHQSIGMGELPDLPMISYLARSLSLFYAWLGALVFFASFDLTRYLPLIRFFAWGGLVVAVLQTWIDATSPVPIWWLLAESAFLFVYFGTLLWLTRKTRDHSA